MSSPDELKKLLDEASSLRKQSKFSEALQLLAQVEKSARELGDQELRKNAVSEQAYLYIDSLGDTTKALEMFSVLEILSMQDQDVLNLLIARYGQGVSLDKMGNQYGKALEKYEQSEELAKQIKHDGILFSTLAKSADIYFKHAENYEKALEKLTPYEQLCRERNDMKQLDSCIRVQALCHEKLAWWSLAVDTYEKRIKLSEELANREVLAFCLIRSAYIMTNHQGRHETALKYYERAENLCREMNDRVNLKAALHGQAFILNSIMKRYTDALGKYKQLEGICREDGDQKELMNVYSSQATIHLEYTGDYEAAMKASKALEDIAADLVDKEHFSASLKNQVFIHKSWGEKKEASEKKGWLKKLKKAD